MLLCLGALFVVTQAGYILLGVRFDWSPLTYAWQMIDVELLRTRLLESCFYLHSQPPGFNLFLGSVLKLFPRTFPTVLHLIYMALGLVLCLTLYAVQRRIGISRVVALVVSILFMASPSVVLYENYLFYTFPLAVLLTVSGLLLFKALGSSRVRWAWLYLLSLFLLCATGSMFHMLFYLMGAGFLVLWSSNRKRVIPAVVVAFLMVFALYAKNWVLFDRFATSSWIGESAWSHIARNISREDLQKLVAEGKLSELALLRGFSPVEDYPAGYSRVETYAHVPVLSQIRKSTGGVNYNHQAYTRTSEQRMRDFLAALRRRPGAMIVGLAASWFIYSTSSSDYRLFTKENMDAVAPIRQFYDFLLYGKVPLDLSKTRYLPVSDNPHYPYVFLLVGLPLLVVIALKLAIMGFRHGTGLPRIQRVIVLYLCLTVLYVAAVGTSLECGECNRFRFMTDPMYVALLGTVLQFQVTPWLKRRLTTGPRGLHSAVSSGEQDDETVERRDAGV
jgi:hypothetical protein